MSLRRCPGREARFLPHLALGFIFSLKHRLAYVLGSWSRLSPGPAVGQPVTSPAELLLESPESFTPDILSPGLWERGSDTRGHGPGAGRTGYSKPSGQ